MLLRFAIEIIDIQNHSTVLDYERYVGLITLVACLTFMT
jgi:hypothetical protein